MNNTADLPKLMEAVYAAFNNAMPGGKWTPRYDQTAQRWITFCNEAFSFICKMMGCSMFDRPETANPDDAELANRICDEIRAPGSGWRKVTNARGAQELANSGRLVGAIYKNLNGGPGHVCAVIPGYAEVSGSWGTDAPKVMNVGKRCFIGMKASFAFTKEEMPEFYVWEGA